MRSLFEEKFEFYFNKVNNALSDCELLKASDRVVEAEIYSLNAGGKRIRSILCMAFYELFGGKEDISNIAIALEMIHTFSLIHDDMPEMDNDDLRRGKPSTHKAYGQDIALLSGDGLAILPFELISNMALNNKISFETAVKLANVLSHSSGNSGMILGQLYDIDAEEKDITIEQLYRLSSLKTGELLKASCVFGAILAEATAEMIKDCEEYAYNIGLAFQMVDDVLDVTSDEKTLGKPINSDSKRKKQTFVDFYGIEGTSKLAKELTQKAVFAISEYNNNKFLVDLAIYLTERKN